MVADSDDHRECTLMVAVWSSVRAQLRDRWRAWAALAVLLGVASGVVLVTAAGARRTDSAYRRFLTTEHAADILVSPNANGYPALYAALARLHSVAAVAPVVGYGTAKTSDVRHPVLLNAAGDGHLAHDVERAKLVHGRMFDAAHADEVVADLNTARGMHLRPGSTLTVAIAGTNEELPDVRHDPVVHLRVVGVVATRDSIEPTNALAVEPTLIAGPAFAHRFGPRFYAYDAAYVRLRPGASKAAFSTAARHLVARFPAAGGGLFVADESQQAARVEHDIRPQAVALGLFSLLAALTAIVALGQVIVRQVHLASTDNATLSGLGMSRLQLLAVGLAPVGAAAVAAAILGVLIAFVASPLMPIGPARVAEPHPGFAIDAVVFALGALGTTVVVMLIAAWPAWRDARRHAGAAHEVALRTPARLHAVLARAGVPATAGVGIGHAVDPGRGTRAVPARSALVGVAVGIAAVTGAATFATNLSRFVGTPRRYGQTWDITADAQFAQVPSHAIDRYLHAHRAVTAWSFGTHADFTVDGRPVPGVSITSAHGPLLAPTVLSGRAATAPGEIALGSKTIASVHRRIGQNVSVAVVGDATQAAHAATRRVVGRSAFPFFGRGSFTPTGLGTGAQVFEQNQRGATYNFVLIRVAPGPQHDTTVSRIAHDLSRSSCTADNQCSVTTASRPVDVMNYARVRSTPVVLAAVLAVIAMLVVAHLLFTSLRRRRRDFAILKTIGFTPRQVSAVVGWQATAVVVLALAVGLPGGVVVGRLAWSTFASNVGAATDVALPALLLASIAIGTLVLTNAIAVVPAYVAAHRAPAGALHAD